MNKDDRSVGQKTCERNCRCETEKMDCLLDLYEEESVRACVYV